MKRHSLVQISLFFKKPKFTLLNPFISILNHQPTKCLFFTNKAGKKFILEKKLLQRESPNLMY